MRESRLFKIIYILLQKRRVSAPELAEKLEVSVRTVYRDLDALSGAGIPVYSTTGRNGGVQLLDTFILRNALFSDSEKQTLLTALQSVSALTGGRQTALIEKLSALFNAQADDWLEIDLTRWGNETADNAKFARLKQAAIERKAVSIDYVNAYGGRRTRKIYPLKLRFKAKDWYLKAYYTEKNAFRLFKFNRILSCVVLDEVFTPLTFPDDPAAESESCEKIVLRFPKEAAYRVFDEFSNDQVQATENGDWIVTAFLPVDAWLVGYLLSFGSSVEIIEPDSLRSVVTAEAEKIIAKNKP